VVKFSFATCSKRELWKRCTSCLHLPVVQPTAAKGNRGWAAFTNLSVVSETFGFVSAGRAAGSGRPVAAVGAVRRPEWSNANSGGGSTAGNDEVLVDTSAQCRPFPMMSGVPYSGNQASMLMADGDATLPGSSLLLNSGCFLPPPMTDDALLASLTAANPGSLYPVDGEW